MQQLRLRPKETIPEETSQQAAVCLCKLVSIQCVSCTSPSSSSVHHITSKCVLTAFPFRASLYNVSDVSQCLCNVTHQPLHYSETSSQHPGHLPMSVQHNISTNVPLCTPTMSVQCLNQCPLSYSETSNQCPGHRSLNVCTMIDVSTTIPFCYSGMSGNNSSASFISPSCTNLA